MFRPAARAATIAAPLLALALLASAAGAARTAPLRFTSVSKSVLQGGSAEARVALRRKADRCTLSVAYAGRAAAKVGTATVTRAAAHWKWSVPKDAPTGAARATVACAHSGKVSRTFVVVGVVLPPRIDVVKQGFSLRPGKTSGARLSYGVILRNASDKEDAVGVTVQVNFVDATNVLYGTATQRVAKLGAGETYDLGGMLTFPGLPPVTRLEVVVRMSGHTPKHAVPVPALANARILPSAYEPAWVGSIEGELANDQPQLPLGRAMLSAVVFDAGGNVIGGGTGYVSNTLPPGARSFFKLTSGVAAIPMAQAATVEFSIVPTWLQPGA